jgi:citrate lyase subunit beta/citryl-CoA lyase
MARRSLLFTPGDRPEMVRKAPDAGSDVIVFDLEDAVAPERKDEAREVVADVLQDPEFDPAPEVCVRVNSVGVAAAVDLDVLADALAGVDAVMVPKVRRPDDVRTLARLLDERDVDADVLALIETAAGVLEAQDIAAVDATDALVFGAEDLAADLGATRTDEGTEVLHAREHVVLAASAAGIDAIDTIHADIEDVAGLREAARFAVQLGYDGKLAIHPGQVDPINDAFTPDEDEIDWAERVLEAKEVADAEGRGVFTVDGEMIDAPLVERAKRTLERARASDESRGN